MSPLAPLALALLLPAAAPGAAADDPFRVLVFSRTEGYRHDSIPDGIAALRELGAAHGFAIEATEDPARFTDAALAPFEVVVFLSTTGDVLDPPQEAALERWVRDGGGWVGIHAASDTEYDWPWYGRLVGAYFAGHPRVQPATICVDDRTHPSTRHLPRRWDRTDEWYAFGENPRGRVHVLMRLDEATYEGGSMGHDHPTAWCHLFEGGRSWYTGGGHTKGSFAEPDFRAHLAGGILWAAGRAEGDAGATVERHWSKVVLDEEVSDPMELAVAADGRVFFVERGGAIKVHDPATGRTTTCGFLDVFDDLEDGLLGIALDPGFATNGRLWLSYAPDDDRPRNRLSCFTLVGDAIDPASERVVLEIPTQRDECCHSGGSIAFDVEGCLYLSTGDNTSPFASDGSAPIDERAGRAPFDAQKSSSNANDLRGKILRILPLDSGGYAIPEGNLFPRDGSAGRPEIYVMGCRNPFRIALDPIDRTLYWGEVGPDAGAPRDGRGPAGHDEYNRTGSAGNFGWPYFVGDSKPYHDYDFATQTPGAAFDAAAPVNDSPNNTGPRALPPARPAWIWYPYGASAEFPWLGSGGRCAMAGPVVRFGALDAALRSPHAVPRMLDGRVILYEWERNRLFMVDADDPAARPALIPLPSGGAITRPMDLELGPDGCLYLIEWGAGFGGGNPDARIVRLEYDPAGRRPPLARVAAEPRSGAVPLTVRFDSSASLDRGETGGLAFAWDFDDDGTIDAEGPRATHRYDGAGDVAATLRVTDAAGGVAVARTAISVGNTAPVVRIVAPPDGGVAGFGETIRYRLAVSDAEEPEIDPASVIVQPHLGHDTHAHPLRRREGLEGAFDVLPDAGHGDAADLFTVLAATWRDGGAPGVAPIATRAEIVLQPRIKQAEHATALDGPRTRKADGDGSVGAALVFERAGDAATIAPMSFAGIEAIVLRVACDAPGAELTLRRDAADGPILGTARIEPTGGIELAAGAHPIRVEYFERTGGAGLILRASGPGFARQVLPAAMLARDAAGAERGLRADWYALDGLPGGGADELPDFDALEPYATTVVTSIDFPSTSDEFAGSGRADHVGCVLSGNIVIREPGTWRFFLESDDGARLLLDGEAIVENDGLHAMRERSSNLAWREVRVPVVDPGGSFALHLVHAPIGAEACTLALDHLRFVGPGVTEGEAPAAPRSRREH